MRVSTEPSTSEVTCVPCGASSARVMTLRKWAAAFDVEYPPMKAAGTTAATESTLTMVPPPLRASTGAKARVMPSVPK